MTTTDLIQALSNDISDKVEEKVLSAIMPLIEQRLYNNTFDVKGAAKYLGLSAGTIYKMVYAGEIPYFKMRGQIFFRQSSIDQWIAEQERTSYKAAQ